METVITSVRQLRRPAGNAHHPGVLALGTLVAASLVASCGLGDHGPPPGFGAATGNPPAVPPPASTPPPASSPPPASTPPPASSQPPLASVTMVISSDANDQLSEVYVVLQSLTLYDSDGFAVSVLDLPQTGEFIHVNGSAQPFVSELFSQGVYTSAQLVLGGATFTCAGVNQGALTVPSFGWSQTPVYSVPSIQVQLPEPITITEGNFLLTLKLNVSQSFYYTNTCDAGDTYESTPIFTLTAAPLATQPTSPQNGAVTGFAGQVQMLNTASSGFTLQLPGPSVAQLSTIPVPPPGSDTPPVTQTSPSYYNVTTDANTQWQGIADLSALTTGMFVVVDGAIQGTGATVLATRIEVEDPSAQNVRQGPLLSVSSAQPAVAEILPVLGQGTDEPFPTENFALGSSTRFQVSGQLTNLATLPFTPVFSAATAVPGQNVSLTAPAFDMSTGANYSAVASTATLMPQTVSGTIVSTSSSGAFTVYQISLPAYDPLSILETQAGLTPLLSNSGVMYVYADSSTMMLNSSPPAAGNTLRFNGLVFNDGGVLRMDCARINDGVTTPPAP